VFKNKLKHLVVPELSAEPGPGEMETGKYKELAKIRKPLSMNLELRRPRLTILSMKKLSLKKKTV